MKVRMLKTMTCYPDGVHALECLQGKKYDLPEVAALSWLKQGFAEEDRVLDVPEETKAAKPNRRARRTQRKK